MLQTIIHPFYTLTHAHHAGGQLFHNFDLLAGALNTLCLGAVDVVVWDPALVISLFRQSPSGDSWSISTNNRDLVLRGHSLLASSR